nr:MAG TPA: hypothetical protein [Caudoviricetes sp.]
MSTTINVSLILLPLFFIFICIYSLKTQKKFRFP